MIDRELGIILENKVIKNSFIKKCAPELLFLNEKNPERFG